MNPSFTPDPRQNVKSHYRGRSKTALYGINNSRKKDKFLPKFDECSCSIPRHGLCWSGKCDDACFTMQDALTRQLLLMYPGQTFKA